jgi:hypothetical protein
MMKQKKMVDSNEELIKSDKKEQNIAVKLKMKHKGSK